MFEIYHISTLQYKYHHSKSLLKCTPCPVAALAHNGPNFFMCQHSMIRIDHPPALPYNAPITALSPYDNSPPCPKIQVSSAMTSHNSSRVIFRICRLIVPYDTNVTTPSHSSNSPLAIYPLVN